MDYKLTDRYKHKIKTPSEIKEIIGEVPRDRKVIMCHGVFDIVHPGHIRHLMYAKGKAPVLVASITADHFINKGTYRPHVPQDLRAVNLAAFEIVDYVVIDEFQTPINNLKIIQPDLFAKGYEYSPNVESFEKTREEIQVVREYGGEVIFTPGDIVYSSSNLINLSPPELKIEKLIMLMSRNSINFDDLNEALDRFKEFNVHVVGDTIIDSYTNCEMIGGQTKTPTMSVKFESRKDVLGGAGIVAEHLKAAGANVNFTSVVGDDVLGKFTMLKIDNLDNSSISDEILNEVISGITKTKSDAIIFSDFRHGIFNKRTIKPLINSIPLGIFKVADSQVASRWGNILDFKGFDLITPNEREARFALADQDSGIRPLASQLYDNCEAGLLILKLGERGILTCLNSNHESIDSFIVMDSFAQRVVDPVGAGDALIAYSTLAMLSTSNPIIASI